MVGRGLGIRHMIITCLRNGIALLVLALAGIVPAHGQGAAMTSTITYVTNIDFGDFHILGSCSNCEITINAATGARTATGGVILRPSNPGKRGQYIVQMEKCGQCSYTASVAPSSVAMNTPGGVMTVLNFTTSQTAMVNRTNTLYVGATLRIPSVAVTGGTHTSGNFTVTTTP